MTDGTKRGCTELAHPFGNRIRCRVDVVRALVEQKMVITEMRAGNVPMEILGLQVERECRQEEGST